MRTDELNFTFLIIELKRVPLIIINLHLITWADTIHRQLRILTELIAEHIALPIIIAGDFNLQNTLWSPIAQQELFHKEMAHRRFRDLLNVRPLKSVFRPEFKNFTRVDDSLNYVSWIDAILYDGHCLKPIKCSIEGVPRSDHRSLTVLIEITGPPTMINNVRHLKIQNWKLKKSFNKLTLDDAVKQIICYPNLHGRWIHKRNKRPTMARVKNGCLKRFDLIKLINNTKNVPLCWKRINKYILQKTPIAPIEHLRCFSPELSRHLETEIAFFNYTRVRFETLSTPTLYRGITTSERAWLMKTTPKTSSGHADDFNRSTWKKFYEHNKSLVINIIDEIFKQGHIPGRLKVSGVTFLVKPDGISTRQLRLQSYLMKLIDKILASRLHKYTEILIGTDQFAYMKNTNRQRAILALNNHLTSFNPILKLDLSKAFDKIDRQIIYRELAEITTEQDLQMIKSFCEERWLRTSYMNKIYYKQDKEGVPQGSSVGPLLFIIGMEHVLRALRNRGMKVIAFADDFIIVLRGDETEGEIRYIIKTCSDEFIKAGLRINESKTVIQCSVLAQANRFKSFNGITVETGISFLGIMVRKRMSGILFESTLRQHLSPLLPRGKLILRLKPELIKCILNAHTSTLLDKFSPTIIEEMTNPPLHTIKRLIHITNKTLQDITNTIGAGEWSQYRLMNLQHPWLPWYTTWILEAIKTSTTFQIMKLLQLDNIHFSDSMITELDFLSRRDTTNMKAQFSLKHHRSVAYILLEDSTLLKCNCDSNIVHWNLLTGLSKICELISTHNDSVPHIEIDSLLMEGKSRLEMKRILHRIKPIRWTWQTSEGELDIANRTYTYITPSQYYTECYYRKLIRSRVALMLNHFESCGSSLLYHLNPSSKAWRIPQWRYLICLLKQLNKLPKPEDCCLIDKKHPSRVFHLLTECEELRPMTTYQNLKYMMKNSKYLIEALENLIVTLKLYYDENKT